MDEEGNFSTMQYWSENHQIGWKAGKYLIGQAFANNPTLEHFEFEASKTNGSIAKLVGKAKLEQWLDYRSRYTILMINSL
jgi:hypothetical protein